MLSGFFRRFKGCLDSHLLRLARERWRLLCMLRPIGSAGIIGLSLAMAVVSLVPACTAWAIGLLVGRIAGLTHDHDGIGPDVLPLVVVGILLTLDLAAQRLLPPVREWAARRVNGGLRRDLRTYISAPPGIDHLDDVRIRSMAEMPVYDIPVDNIGEGAEGQLWLISRFVGAAASAALLAWYFSPLAATIEFCCMAAQRAMLRRQYTSTSPAISDVATADRGAAYWRDVVGGITGAKEVRVFGFGEWAAGEFVRTRRLWLDMWKRIATEDVVPHQWITFLLSGLGTGVPLLMLAYAALNDRLPIFHLAVAVGAVVSLAQLGNMGYEAFGIERAVAALPELDALAHEGDPGGDTARRPPRTSAGHETKPGTPHAGTIRFEDVRFRYPGSDREILTGLNLCIEPGESVALVGRNGAGKTTLVKLLAGFYQPTAGRILIDGEDLRDLDLPQWRRRLAVILQDFAHFELSARDNVALAAVDGSDLRAAARADLHAAAEAAGALTVVDKLPRAWDTVLSRNYRDGAEISGGQWQRIGLARAIFAVRRGAHVLVLDEPTAHLDVRAETALFDRILEYADNITAIVVSHRFSTVRRARRIVVLAQGRVAEDGSHDELMNQAGSYAFMYRLQAAQYAGSSGPARPPAQAEEANW